jgi:DNA-binding NarL/FixJ family response regulator
VQLVGRAAEFDAIAASIADVAAGGVQAIGVIGEAGIGKSVLLQVVSDRAAADARRAAAAEGPESLNERERDVAALVAQGRTNRQIGATMFLSEKTIEYYLTRIYGKLGVRTRTELAATVGAI